MRNLFDVKYYLCKFVLYLKITFYTHKIKNSKLREDILFQSIVTLFGFIQNCAKFKIKFL